MSIFDKVYQVVKQIPIGYVATYGQIARMLGNVRWARIVGYALHDNPDGDLTPCYRVVNKEGRTAPGWSRQRSLLEEEGVHFKADGHVDMRQYLWEIKDIYDNETD